MNTRIQLIIDASKIKKSDFAKKIKVSAPFVSELCSGAKAPSDRTIQDICDKFRVNEDWLRYGEGEMFLPQSRNDEIAAFMGRLLDDPNPSFQRRLISVLAKLEPKEWEILEEMALRLIEEAKEKPDQ